MNNTNLNKYISTDCITFLIDIDKVINIEKNGKYYYDKSFKIELENINNFLNNLEDDEVYLINPLISINCKYNDPYLTLSRQFLVTNQSKPKLITNFIINMFNKAKKEFNFDVDNFYLLLKYKKVYLTYKKIDI